jgi:3-oxoacyl-[acyl-carrier protein] reductase
MRVLVVSTAADPVAEALSALGLDVAHDGLDAEGLVTVVPEPEAAAPADLDPPAWEASIRRGAEEPFFAAQPWLRAARARGSGSWVAVTSILGTQPFPHGGAAGAAALMLQTLVRVAALEGGPHGVRANAVAPGWLQDGVPAGLDPGLAVADTPLRRLATAADVASAVAWLLSPAAAHVTGEVVRIDGGYTISKGSRPDPRKE